MFRLIMNSSRDVLFKHEKFLLLNWSLLFKCSVQ